MIQELLTDLRSADLLVRRQAAAALKSHGSIQAIPALIEALLHDEDEWVRIDATEALGKIGDKRALPALLVALKSEALIKKWQAEWEKLPAIADKQQHDKRYLFLWETLVVEISDIRVAAANALGQIGDEEAVPGLTEAWNDEHDRNVREAAEQALKKIGTPRALAVLTKKGLESS